MTAPMSSAPAIALGELSIDIQLTGPSFVVYGGTAAQLIEERLVPPGFKWPDGRKPVSWTVGDLRYVLMRVRPEGHKGPAKSWHGLDNWRVTTSIENSRWEEYRVERKLREMGAVIHRHSEAGVREAQRRIEAHGRALSDAAFQSFKACVMPASARRGARPKASSPLTQGGAQA